MSNSDGIGNVRLRRTTDRSRDNVRHQVKLPDKKINNKLSPGSSSPRSPGIPSPMGGSTSKSLADKDRSESGSTSKSLADKDRSESTASKQTIESPSMEEGSFKTRSCARASPLTKRKLSNEMTSQAKDLNEEYQTDRRESLKDRNKKDGRLKCSKAQDSQDASEFIGKFELYGARAVGDKDTKPVLPSSRLSQTNKIKENEDRVESTPKECQKKTQISSGSLNSKGKVSEKCSGQSPGDINVKDVTKSNFPEFLVTENKEVFKELKNDSDIPKIKRKSINEFVEDAGNVSPQVKAKKEPLQQIKKDKTSESPKIKISKEPVKVLKKDAAKMSPQLKEKESPKDREKEKADESPKVKSKKELVKVMKKAVANASSPQKKELIKGKLSATPQLKKIKDPFVDSENVKLNDFTKLKDQKEILSDMEREKANALPQEKDKKEPIKHKIVSPAIKDNKEPMKELEKDKAKTTVGNISNTAGKLSKTAEITSNISGKTSGIVENTANNVGNTSNTASQSKESRKHPSVENKINDSYQPVKVKKGKNRKRETKDNESMITTKDEGNSSLALSLKVKKNEDKVNVEAPTNENRETSVDEEASKICPGEINLGKTTGTLGKTTDTLVTKTSDSNGKGSQSVVSFKKRAKIDSPGKEGDKAKAENKIRWIEKCVTGKKLQEQNVSETVFSLVDVSADNKSTSSVGEMKAKLKVNDSAFGNPLLHAQWIQQRKTSMQQSNLTRENVYEGRNKAATSKDDIKVVSKIVKPSYERKSNISPSKSSGNISSKSPSQVLCATSSSPTKSVSLADNKSYGNPAFDKTSDKQSPLETSNLVTIAATSQGSGSPIRYRKIHIKIPNQIKAPTRKTESPIFVGDTEVVSYLRDAQDQQSKGDKSMTSDEPPVVGEQSVTPEVGEQSVTPEVGEQSVTPQVGEQSVTPQVGEQSVIPEIEEEGHDSDSELKLRLSPTPQKADLFDFTDIEAEEIVLGENEDGPHTAGTSKDLESWLVQVPNSKHTSTPKGIELVTDEVLESSSEEETPKKTAESSALSLEKQQLNLLSPEGKVALLDHSYSSGNSDSGGKGSGSSQKKKSPRSTEKNPSVRPVYSSNSMAKRPLDIMMHNDKINILRQMSQIFNNEKPSEELSGSEEEMSREDTGKDSRVANPIAKGKGIGKGKSIKDIKSKPKTKSTAPFMLTPEKIAKSSPSKMLLVEPPQSHHVKDLQREFESVSDGRTSSLQRKNTAMETSSKQRTDHDKSDLETEVRGKSESTGGADSDILYKDTKDKRNVQQAPNNEQVLEKQDEASSETDSEIAEVDSGPNESGTRQELNNSKIQQSDAVSALKINDFKDISVKNTKEQSFAHLPSKLDKDTEAEPKLPNICGKSSDSSPLKIPKNITDGEEKVCDKIPLESQESQSKETEKDVGNDAKQEESCEGRVVTNEDPISSCSKDDQCLLDSTPKEEPFIGFPDTVAKVFHVSSYAAQPGENIQIHSRLGPKGEEIDIIDGFSFISFSTEAEMMIFSKREQIKSQKKLRKKGRKKRKFGKLKKGISFRKPSTYPPHLSSESNVEQASAFSSNDLDAFLDNCSRLNISYSIPKCKATEEGVTKIRDDMPEDDSTMAEGNLISSHSQMLESHNMPLEPKNTSEMSISQQSDDTPSDAIQHYEEVNAMDILYPKQKYKYYYNEELRKDTKADGSNVFVRRAGKLVPLTSVFKNQKRPTPVIIPKKTVELVYIYDGGKLLTLGGSLTKINPSNSDSVRARVALPLGTPQIEKGKTINNSAKQIQTVEINEDMAKFALSALQEPYTKEDPAIEEPTQSVSSHAHPKEESSVADEREKDKGKEKFKLVEKKIAKPLPAKHVKPNKTNILDIIAAKLAMSDEESDENEEEKKSEDKNLESKSDETVGKQEEKGKASTSREASEDTKNEKKIADEKKEPVDENSKKEENGESEDKNSMNFKSKLVENNDDKDIALEKEEEKMETAEMKEKDESDPEKALSTNDFKDTKHDEENKSILTDASSINDKVKSDNEAKIELGSKEGELSSLDGADSEVKITTTNKSNSLKIFKKNMLRFPSLSREMKRLNMNFVNYVEQASDEVEETEKEAEIKVECTNDFCNMGCICESLSCTRKDPEHCGRIECMFKCTCRDESWKHPVSGSGRTMNNASIFSLDREQMEGLAIREKDFKRTVIQTGSEVILVGAERKKRERRLPGRYRDSGAWSRSEWSAASTSDMSDLKGEYPGIHIREAQKYIKKCSVNIPWYDIKGISVWCMDHSCYDCNCFTDYSYRTRDDDSTNEIHQPYGKDGKTYPSPDGIKEEKLLTPSCVIVNIDVNNVEARRWYCWRLKEWYHPVEQHCARTCGYFCSKKATREERKQMTISGNSAQDETPEQMVENVVRTLRYEKSREYNSALPSEFEKVGGASPSKLRKIVEAHKKNLNDHEGKSDKDPESVPLVDLTTDILENTESTESQRKRLSWLTKVPNVLKNYKRSASCDDRESDAKRKKLKEATSESRKRPLDSAEMNRVESSNNVEAVVLKKSGPEGKDVSIMSDFEEKDASAVLWGEERSSAETSVSEVKKKEREIDLVPQLSKKPLSLVEMMNAEEKRGELELDLTDRKPGRAMLVSEGRFRKLINMNIIGVIGINKAGRCIINTVDSALALRTMQRIHTMIRNNALDVGPNMREIFFPPTHIITRPRYVMIRCDHALKWEIVGVVQKKGIGSNVTKKSAEVNKSKVSPVRKPASANPQIIDLEDETTKRKEDVTEPPPTLETIPVKELESCIDKSSSNWEGSMPQIACVEGGMDMEIDDENDDPKLSSGDSVEMLSDSNSSQLSRNATSVPNLIPISMASDLLDSSVATLTPTVRSQLSNFIHSSITSPSSAPTLSNDPILRSSGVHRIRFNPAGRKLLGEKSGNSFLPLSSITSQSSPTSSRESHLLLTKSPTSNMNSNISSPSFLSRTSPNFESLLYSPEKEDSQTGESLSQSSVASFVQDQKMSPKTKDAANDEIGVAFQSSTSPAAQMGGSFPQVSGSTLIRSSAKSVSFGSSGSTFTQASGLKSLTFGSAAAQGSIMVPKIVSSSTSEVSATVSSKIAQASTLNRTAMSGNALLSPTKGASFKQNTFQMIGESNVRPPLKNLPTTPAALPQKTFFLPNSSGTMSKMVLLPNQSPVSSPLMVMPPTSKAVDVTPQKLLLVPSTTESGKMVLIPMPPSLENRAQLVSPAGGIQSSSIDKHITKSPITSPIPSCSKESGSGDIIVLDPPSVSKSCSKDQQCISTSSSSSKSIASKSSFTLKNPSTSVVSSNASTSNTVLGMIQNNTSNITFQSSSIISGKKSCDSLKSSKSPIDHSNLSKPEGLTLKKAEVYNTDISSDSPVIEYENLKSTERIEETSTKESVENDKKGEEIQEVPVKPPQIKKGGYHWSAVDLSLVFKSVKLEWLLGTIRKNVLVNIYRMSLKTMSPVTLSVKNGTSMSMLYGLARNSYYDHSEQHCLPVLILGSLMSAIKSSSGTDDSSLFKGNAIKYFIRETTGELASYTYSECGTRLVKLASKKRGVSGEMFGVGDVFSLCQFRDGKYKESVSVPADTPSDSQTSSSADCSCSSMGNFLCMGHSSTTSSKNNNETQAVTLDSTSVSSAQVLTIPLNPPTIDKVEPLKIPPLERLVTDSEKSAIIVKQKTSVVSQVNEDASDIDNTPGLSNPPSSSGTGDCEVVCVKNSNQSSEDSPTDTATTTQVTDDNEDTVDVDGDFDDSALISNLRDQMMNENNQMMQIGAKKKKDRKPKGTLEVIDPLEEKQFPTPPLYVFPPPSTLSHSDGVAKPSNKRKADINRPCPLSKKQNIDDRAQAKPNSTLFLAKVRESDYVSKAPLSSSGIEDVTPGPSGIGSKKSLRKREPRYIDVESMDDRSTVHNELERNRRKALRILFTNLGSAIIQSDPDYTVECRYFSKIHILTKATELCQELKEKSRRLTYEELGCKTERSALIKKLAVTVAGTPPYIKSKWKEWVEKNVQNPTARETFEKMWEPVDMEKEIMALTNHESSMDIDTDEGSLLSAPSSPVSFMARQQTSEHPTAIQDTSEVSQPKFESSNQSHFVSDSQPLLQSDNQQSNILQHFESDSGLHQESSILQHNDPLESLVKYVCSIPSVDSLFSEVVTTPPVVVATSVPAVITPTSPAISTTSENVNIVSPLEIENQEIAKPSSASKKYPKPPYSYTKLIALAFKNSKTGSLYVQDIYKFIRSFFPYFRDAPKSWKNSIRHNLSMSRGFRRVEMPKRSGNSRPRYIWTINPAHQFNFELKPNLVEDLIRSMEYPEFLDYMKDGTLNVEYSSSDEEELKEDTNDYPTLHIPELSEPEGNSSSFESFKQIPILVFQQGKGPFQNMDVLLSSNEVSPPQREVLSTKGATSTPVDPEIICLE